MQIGESVPINTALCPLVDDLIFILLINVCTNGWECKRLCMYKQLTLTDSSLKAC